MNAFDILADPVRRRILELLAHGELSSGDVVAVIAREYGISQSAVSQHLRVLRENGFATVRSAGSRRIYSVDAAPLLEVDAWLETFRHFWAHRLEALATEVARGKHERAMNVSGSSPRSVSSSSRRSVSGSSRPASARPGAVTGERPDTPAPAGPEPTGEAGRRKDSKPRSKRGPG